MASLLKLLTAGMFPSELPQPFTSTAFGTQISKSHRSGSLPMEILPSGAKFKNPKPTISGRHILVRTAGRRRELAIVNPWPYLRLAHEIVDSWPQIESLLNESSLSASTPVFDRKKPRAVVGRIGINSRKYLRLKYRATKKYVLKADIQAFYPSIYTHALAWSIHSKHTAKSRRRDFTLLGNRLDALQRACQSGETSGILTGPDTSYILAEILLSAIDKELVAEIGPDKGFRFVDDFELSFTKLGEAENARAILHEILAGYKLTLNSNKTEIIELPKPVDGLWPLRIREFQIPANASRDQIIDYFDLAYDLANEYPSDSVLRYALARIHFITPNAGASQTYQLALCQSALNEPHTLKYVLRALKRHESVGNSIDKELVGETINNLICKHAPLGHGTEVAWAIWSACALSVEISEQSANALSKRDDSIVALLALDADSRGLCPSGLDKSSWQSQITSDQLSAENWLLAYEATLQGWLGPSGKKDHIAANPFFEFLRTHNIKFYNRRASSLIVPRATSKPRFDLVSLLLATGLRADDEALRGSYYDGGDFAE